MHLLRSYFPNGELDDYGGAIPPLCAGLEPSYAEEEAATGNVEYIFARLDAHAAAVQAKEALAGGLPALAAKLASACSRAGELKAYDQLQVRAAGVDGLCAVPLCCAASH